MSNSASVRIRDSRFPAGTTVGLYDRHGPVFAGLGAERVASGRVKATGEVEIDGLPAGGRYFAAAEVNGRVVQTSVTAKVAPAAKSRLTHAQAREKLAQTRFDPPDRTVRVGARNANDRAKGSRGEPFVSSAVGKATAKGDLPIEAHPHRRIEDAGNREKLRSHTLTGEAHPTSPDEPQPALRQDQVPDGAQQRSATPLGEATIIPAGEVQPAQRQEDVEATVRQRSATRTGTAEPLPPDAQPPKRSRSKKPTKGSTAAERSATKKGTRTAPKARRRNRTSTQQRRAPAARSARSQRTGTKRTASGRTKRA